MITQSAEIAKLAEALAKAQGEIESAIKDSTNPHYKSTYADLASVWDACRGPLSKYGLSVTQRAGRDEVGICLSTTLMHSSGQWVQGVMPLLLSKNDMQGFGSALTYARRYSLAAIVGVAQDDDDGNGATGRGIGKGKTPVHPDEPGEDDVEPPKPPPVIAPVITPVAKGKTKADLGREIVRVGKLIGASEKEVTEWASEESGKPANQMSVPELEKFLDVLRGEAGRKGIVLV